MLRADAVAAVDGRFISQSALEQVLTRHGWYNPTLEQKRSALDELVQRESLYSKALRARWETNEVVQAALKNYLISAYREHLEQELTAASPPTEPEIVARYESLVRNGRLHEPEQAWTAMLFLPLNRKAAPEKRLELKARMENLRTLALETCQKEPGFGILSITNSAHQQSRYRGGDIGWMSPELAGQLLDAKVVPAMFALKTPGELSPVIEGENGFYLLKSIDRKPASTRPLSETRASIIRQLQQEQTQARQTAFNKSLKDGAIIQIQDAALDRVTGPTAPVVSQPPRLSSR